VSLPHVWHDSLRYHMCDTTPSDTCHDCIIPGVISRSIPEVSSWLDEILCVSVWHDWSSTRVTRLLQVRAMTASYQEWSQICSRGLFVTEWDSMCECVPWLVAHTCDTTPLDMCHDYIISGVISRSVPEIFLSVNEILCVSLWHDLFACVTWLINIWHDVLICKVPREYIQLVLNIHTQCNVRKMSHKFTHTISYT